MSDMIWLSDSMCFGKKVSLQSRRKMKKCCWVEFGQTRGICISKAGVTHNLGSHKKHRRTDSIPRHKWDPTVSMSVMDRIWVQHPSVTKTYSQHKSTSFHTHLFPQPTQINISWIVRAHCRNFYGIQWTQIVGKQFGDGKA